ncbi:MAG: hypothetical protein E6I88_00380 [Chloroflexi bacterium]|nr:MAG: hypothetical protein E6I88_00380 [Chloroflexota bacterium]TME43838.1 MAG: hypothetical protein E6I56_13345 [Chloroflexota bacterium]
MLPDGFTNFLTSRRHLVGCALALLGAVLALLDPVGPAGLVLVGGFYLVGVAAARPDRSHHDYGFDPRQVARAMQQELADVTGRVPADVLVQLQRIELLIRVEVLPRLECLPPGSLDLYLVERTAVEYLPSAVEHYLRVTAGPVSGQTASQSIPLQILSDELRLLEDEMRRIATVVQSVDVDRMLAHRRFLSGRFGRLDPSG